MILFWLWYSVTACEVKCVGGTQETKTNCPLTTDFERHDIQKNLFKHTREYGKCYISTIRNNSPIIKYLYPEYKLLKTSSLCLAFITLKELSCGEEKSLSQLQNTRSEEIPRTGTDF